jgi:hypothetical protein
MTSIPIARDRSQARERSISNQTLILSAGSKQVLAILNARYPLMFPPGSVLQFDGPPGELVVTRVGVTVGEASGIVWAEAEPVAKPVYNLASAAHDIPAEQPGRLRSASGGLTRWSRVRPGNGRCEGPVPDTPEGAQLGGRTLPGAAGHGARGRLDRSHTGEPLRLRQVRRAHVIPGAHHVRALRRDRARQVAPAGTVVWDGTLRLPGQAASSLRSVATAASVGEPAPPPAPVARPAAPLVEVLACGRGCGARADRIMASEARTSSSLTYRRVPIIRRMAVIAHPERWRR